MGRFPPADPERASRFSEAAKDEAAATMSGPARVPGQEKSLEGAALGSGPAAGAHEGLHVLGEAEAVLEAAHASVISASPMRSRERAGRSPRGASASSQARMIRSTDPKARVEQARAAISLSSARIAFDDGEGVAAEARADVALRVDLLEEERYGGIVGDHGGESASSWACSSVELGVAGIGGYRLLQVEARLGVVLAPDIDVGDGHEGLGVICVLDEGRVQEIERGLVGLLHPGLQVVQD